MENKFYDELETLATYPLALLTQEERSEIISNGDKAPWENIKEEQKNKIAYQIDNFLSENEQFLSDHVHEVKIIDSINKLREKCDNLGIPWEKAHIVQTLKRAAGAIKSDNPIFANLPNEFLLPFLLSWSKNVNELKQIYQNNARMQDVMSDPHAIYKLCRNPFYEWGITGELAVDFLTEYASTVADLQVDLSFCRDLNDTLLRKLAKSCPNIVSINLSGCTNISDEGIENFKTNHHLKHIYCFDCQNVTTTEESHLRKLMPHCTIYG